MIVTDTLGDLLIKLYTKEHIKGLIHKTLGGFMHVSDFKAALVFRKNKWVVYCESTPNWEHNVSKTKIHTQAAHLCVDPEVDSKGIVRGHIVNKNTNSCSGCGIIIPVDVDLEYRKIKLKNEKKNKEVLNGS